MLNPANRQTTSVIVENSAMFGVPIQLHRLVDDPQGPQDRVDRPEVVVQHAVEEQRRRGEADRARQEERGAEEADPGLRSCTSRARPSATADSRTVVMTVYFSVKRTASRNSGLSAILV